MPRSDSENDLANLAALTLVVAAVLYALYNADGESSSSSERKSERDLSPQQREMRRLEQEVERRW